MELIKNAVAIMRLQIKLARADGSRVQSVLKVADVLKAEGFEFLHGVKGARRAAGLFLIVEAIYTGAAGELLPAINRAASILGAECIYEDDSYSGCMFRLPHNGEAAALEAANEKLRAKRRAQIARERKQEEVDARAWARYDAQQAA